jgi:DNA repair protein RecO (recombination protein O)
MVEIATGLVLRTRPLTETSLIVHWLTKDLGRLATVAKGARRPQSPFRGKLDLFYLADFSFSRCRRSELHTLREVSPLNTHRFMRAELVYLQQAAYCAALLEQTTETETPLPGAFELLTGLLRHFPEQPARPRNIFAFELKLLSELGLDPDLESGRLGQDTRLLVKALKEGSWLEVSKLEPTKSQVTELSKFLTAFLIFHLGKIPKGRAAALGQMAPEGPIQ